MLEIAGLSVAYGLHRAVDGVSLRVGAKEIVAILGANGAGKTSLLKGIAAIVPKLPNASVRLGGRDVADLAPHLIVEAGLALVPEGRGIFGDLSVGDNLMLGAYPRRARSGEAGRLARVMDLFPKLEQRRSQLARTMSGGEQQMLAIGRALMSAPDVLLLDEPSLGLSPLLCTELFAALARIRDDGVSILVVEQNANQTLAIANRAYLMENSRITGEGTAADLRNDPAVRRAFLGGELTPSA